MHLNPEFMWSLFNLNPVSYNLRAVILVTLPPANSVRYGTNSLLFRGSLLWNALPSVVKSSPTLRKFKKNITTIGTINCSCSVKRYFNLIMYIYKEK